MGAGAAASFAQGAPAPATGAVPVDGLTLGSISLAGYAMPDKIPFGVEQSIGLHELVGGGRVLQSLGGQLKPLAWHGWLYGPDAVERARALVAAALKGAPIRLAWGGFAYLVVIRRCEPEFHAGWIIPYHLQCEPVADLRRGPARRVVSAAQALQHDSTDIGGLAQTLGNAQILASVPAVAAGITSVIASGVANPVGAVAQLLPGAAAALSTAGQAVAATAQLVTAAQGGYRAALTLASPGFAGFGAGMSAAAAAGTVTGLTQAYGNLAVATSMATRLSRLGRNLAQLT